MKLTHNLNTTNINIEEMVKKLNVIFLLFFSSLFLLSFSLTNEKIKINLKQNEVKKERERNEERAKTTSNQTMLIQKRRRRNLAKNNNIKETTITTTTTTTRTKTARRQQTFSSIRTESLPNTQQQQQQQRRRRLGARRLSNKNPYDKSFNFLMIGDWGDGSTNQTETGKVLGQYASIIDSKFVIALGDNFYGDGVESSNDNLWQNYYHSIYTSSSLKIPWYPVLGNHDWHGNAEAQIERTSVTGEDMWEMSNYYYSKEFTVPGGGKLGIIFLDTAFIDSSNGDTDSIADGKYTTQQLEQYKWLESTLERFQTSQHWIIVVGHYPIYSIGSNGDRKYMIANLEPILLKYKVHLYCNGHDHLHQHIY